MCIESVKSVPVTPFNCDSVNGETEDTETTDNTDETETEIPEEKVVKRKTKKVMPEQVRKSTRTRKEKKQCDDFVYAFNVTEAADPQSYKDAKSRSNSDHGDEPMKSEYDFLVKNEVWTLVPRPEGRVLSTRWLYKLKHDAEGKPVRAMARLVRGFDQRQGVDYFSTFSPTVCLHAIRLLFALAVDIGLTVHHVDIATAFLQGELDEEIYVEQPQGYEQGNSVCKLKKAMYGLQQASSAWNRTSLSD